MPIEILQGLAIPFLGTTLGAACVFLLRGELDHRIQKAFTGFAAGIMVAASIWSLLIPAMEESSALGSYAVLPAVVGFWVGTLFLLLLDHIIPHLHLNSDEAEGPKSALSKNLKLVLAGWLTGGTEVSLGAALALSLGIAIQNFPEGAIISLPLAANGEGRTKAFVLGTLSGIVEPIGGALTIVAASFVVPVLPYLLAFAAGAMLYVVVEELIPEMSAGHHSNIGVIAFSVGFTLMMALDTVLG